MQITSPVGRKVILWVASVAVVSIGLNAAAEATRWNFWRTEAKTAIKEVENRTEAQVAGIRAPTVALEGCWTVTLRDGEKHQGLVGLRAGQVEVGIGASAVSVPIGKVKSIVR